MLIFSFARLCLNPELKFLAVGKSQKIKSFVVVSYRACDNTFTVTKVTSTAPHHRQHGSADLL